MELMTVVVSNLQTLKYINNIYKSQKMLTSIYQRKKRCVDIIGPELLVSEERPKSIIKVGTMTNPVLRLSQSMYTYDD